MDKSCENPIRSVKLKGDNLTVHVKNCDKCQSCKDNNMDVEVLRIIESEKHARIAYVRLARKRTRPEREIILLD